MSDRISSYKKNVCFVFVQRRFETEIMREYLVHILFLTFTYSDRDSEGDFIPATCNFFMKLQFLSLVNVAFHCIMFVHHYVVHTPRATNNTTSDANSVLFLFWGPPSPLSLSVNSFCAPVCVCVCVCVCVERAIQLYSS